MIRSNLHGCELQMVELSLESWFTLCTVEPLFKTKTGPRSLRSRSSGYPALFSVIIWPASAHRIVLIGIALTRIVLIGIAFTGIALKRIAANALRRHVQAGGRSVYRGPARRRANRMKTNLKFVFIINCQRVFFFSSFFIHYCLLNKCLLIDCRRGRLTGKRWTRRGERSRRTLAVSGTRRGGKANRRC